MKGNDIDLQIDGKYSSRPYMTLFIPYIGLFIPYMGAYLLSVIRYRQSITLRHSARYCMLGHERPGWCSPTGRCAYLPSVTCYRQSIKPPPPPPPPPPSPLPPDLPLLQASRQRAFCGHSGCSQAGAPHSGPPIVSSIQCSLVLRS